MCSDLVVIQGMVALLQPELALAVFEENLDRPPVAIDCNDLLFIQRDVRGQEDQEILAVGAVADKDHLDLLLVAVVVLDGHNPGKQVFCHAPSLLRGTEDLGCSPLPPILAGICGPALLGHAHDVISLFQDGEYLRRRGEPAVEQDIVCLDLRLIGAVDELEHGQGRLLLRHLPSLVSGGVGANLGGFVYPHLLVLGAQGALGDRKKRLSIRIPEGEHPQTLVIHMLGMVVAGGKQLDLLGTVALEGAVVQDKTAQAGQRGRLMDGLQLALDDRGGEKRGEPVPVDPG